jgi:FecR protein
VDETLARGSFQRFATICMFAISLPICTRGASLKEARVTAIIRDVHLVPTNAAPQPALLNDELREGGVVQTGGDSRAELTFGNRAIARLNANSLFNFKRKSDCDLIQGAALIQAPKGVNAVRIHAAGVALAISGATAVIEHQPGVFKVLVLEGTGRLYRPGHLGDSVLAQPGQMLFGNPNAALSDPVDFDVDRFVKTCRLIRDFPPLQSEKLIAAASQQQQRAKSRRILIDTNLVIFGGGTAVTLVNPATTTVTGAVASDSTLPEPSPIPNSTPARTLAEVRR